MSTSSEPTSDEFTIYNLVKCEINPIDYHILNDARSLPCGLAACYTCIEKNLLDGQLDCKLCNQIHNINLKELPRLVPIERVIDTHIVRLTKYLIDKSKEINSNMCGKLK